MKISLDVSTDYSKKELYVCLHDSNVPQYIKEASLDEDLTGLPKEAFADEGRRAFPLHNKEHTYLSNCYFINKKADIEKMIGEGYATLVEYKIKRAAEILGIQTDIAQYNEWVKIKQASATDPKYMLNQEVHGNKVMLFPVKTSADLSAAAEAFTRTRHNLPMEWRFDTAKNMVKAAKDLGVDELPDLVCKYAGMFYADPNVIKTELWRRSRHLENVNSKEAYEKLIGDVDNMSSNDDIVKLAETCYFTELLDGCYNQKNAKVIFPDPVERFFSLSIEKVADFMNVVTMGGETFNMSDLIKVSKTTYADAFGVEIDPTDVEKLAEVLPTMPRSDVQLFKELSGVKPI